MWESCFCWIAKLSTHFMMCFSSLLGYSATGGGMGRTKTAFLRFRKCFVLCKSLHVGWTAFDAIRILCTQTIRRHRERKMKRKQSKMLNIINARTHTLHHVNSRWSFILQLLTYSPSWISFKCERMKKKRHSLSRSSPCSTSQTHELVCWFVCHSFRRCKTLHWLPII